MPERKHDIEKLVTDVRFQKSSRLNLFYILQVLSSYLDAEHPLSASEIRDKVNEEFGYLSSTDSILKPYVQNAEIDGKAMDKVSYLNIPSENHVQNAGQIERSIGFVVR